jgi:hypothetical protein
MSEVSEDESKSLQIMRRGRQMLVEWVDLTRHVQRCHRPRLAR